MEGEERGVSLKPCVCVQAIGYEALSGCGMELRILCECFLERLFSSVKNMKRQVPLLCERKQ